MSSELTGQVAAVTGGGRGIGRAMAQALAAAGAQVVALARSVDELDETTALIPGVRTFHMDVTNAPEVTKVFSEIGVVDLLVNNAGFGGPLGPLVSANADEWWRTLDVNVRGPLLCSQAVLPGMIARRRGRIINVSSAAANMTVENFSAYVTSKAALNRLTELVAAEVKQHGISVFALSPGPVHTAMSAGLLNSPEAKKWLPWFQDVFDKHAVGPELAANLVVRIATGAEDARTGQFLSAV